MRMHLTLLLLCATACDRQPSDGGDCDLAGPHAVVATTDFRVGALAAVTADGCVADTLSSTSADAVVRATGGRVWVLNRTGGEGLLAYRRGHYRTPELEIGLLRNDNPHDLVEIDGQLFVSAYDRAELVVLDATDGSRIGAVDLAAHADADGLPEADALVELDGSLYLSLQRLDRHEDWSPAGPGHVVRIDTDALVVDATWEVGQNPRLSTAGDALVVLSGAFFAADGALEILDLVDPDGDVEVLLEEDDVGLDLGTEGGGVVLGTAFEEGGDSVVACWRGGWQEAARSSAWYVDARQADGEVLVAARRGWTGHGAVGLWAVDSDGCAVRPWGGDTLLDPFSLAWVP